MCFSQMRFEQNTDANKIFLIYPSSGTKREKTKNFLTVFSRSDRFNVQLADN